MTEHCARCGAPAGIVMSYHYGDRHIWLDDIRAPIELGKGLALCEEHAGRMTPPVGWTLVDRRAPVRPLFASLEVA